MQVVVRSRPGAPTGRRWERWIRAPLLRSAIICFALAALSAAVLPTVPSYDPWSWIVWGREVFDPHLSFTVGGGPSWKPLPVIFTAVYGLFGGAAPTLWVITARAGGLMALLAAYRLASRLVADVPAGSPGGVGREREWRISAGVVAAIGIGLTQEFAYYMFRGTSEPLLLATSLWAVDRHLEGRVRSAFLLGVATSLMRPEAWPFTLLYAVWLWRGDRSTRTVALLGLGLLSIPFFWFVPPWIGTGQPFIAASHAHSYNGHLGSNPFITVVHRGIDLQVVPYFVLGVVAIVLAWRRRFSSTAIGLSLAAAAWWVLVIAMTLLGYPGLERFYLPAAGLLCVLGAAGGVWVAHSVAAWVAARSGRLTAGAVAVGIAVLLLAVSVPFTISRVDEARAAHGAASRAVTRLDQLTAAVAAVGGHRGVFPCATSFAAVNHSAQTALAWKLHVTLERVGTSMRHSGVLFVGPHDSIDGGAAPINPALNRKVFLGQVGVWRMYRLYRAGHLSSCIGS